MRVLITGGAGYVGSTLTQLLLEEGHSVRSLDNLSRGGHALLGFWSHPRFQFQCADVRDPETVRAALRDVDAVVHLAAIVGDPACTRQPESARSINLRGSLDLFQACTKCDVRRFVFASTCSNYGRMLNPNGYVDETSELRPVSLYAETKVAVEEALLSSSGIDLVATPLRFATVFGVSPRMRFDLTVNEFALEMLTKKHLVVFGEQFWRPYIHVRDAARAIALVLNSPAEKVNRRVFNVGSTGQNYRKQEIVELIRRYVPDAAVEYVHREEDPRDYRVSFGRIENELSFRMSLSVEDGIREVLSLIQTGVLQDWGNPLYRN